MKWFATLAFAVMASAPAQAETLRVAIDLLPPSLGNPYRTAQPPTVWTTYAMFDGLTRFDATGNIVPALAASWTKVDNLTWRFTLRPGVTFHNGAPLTSEAIVTAVDYAVSEAAARDGLRREVGVLKSARAVDPLTVEIVTTEPAPQMPRYASAIMPAEPSQWKALGRDGFAKAPVGTGPFKMVKMEENIWRLEAFPQSWRAPKLSALEIIAVPETSARVAGLLADRIHIALSLGPDVLDTVTMAGGQSYVSHDPSVFGFSFLMFKKGPWQDVRVRRALNMAIDRDRIIAGLLDGTTVPATQPAARNVAGYNPDVPRYPYDPGAAKKLLAEAGFPDGFSFVLEGAVGIDANDAAIFQQVQSDLKAIGVTVSLRTIPAAQYFNALRGTDFNGDAFPVDWPSWPTIDITRSILAHSCFRPVPWFCDHGAADKLVAARTEWGETKALALKRELAQYYHDQAPAIFLYETVNFAAVSRRVTDFTMINGAHIPFEQIGLKP